MQKIPVLILAGSRFGEQDHLALAGNVSHKALLPVAGVPMVERVYASVVASEIASRIYLSSEDESWIGKSPLKEASFLPSLQTLPETMKSALNVTGFPCLVVTADHALLQPEWLIEFLSKSEKSPADLTVGIALKEKVQALPIKTKRTYIPLSDMQFSTCNLFLLKKPASRKILDLWQRIHHLRKSPLRMLPVLGFSFVLRALFKRLDSNILLKRISSLTEASLAFVTLENGRAAIDVDTVSDWKDVETLLQLDKESKCCG